jgi:lipopolysaccharide transport system ATP-binding protein
MSDVVISAEGLGKKYLIGHEKRERYTALRDVLMRTARGFVRSAVDMAHGRQLVAGDEIEEFFALKDVSFEIKRGDTVGVIGRNGAGKSTLLKILSRITEPSEGRVEIRGRVASLLEVGTGFHPELTGRENIYLNGAILGMSRAEIRRKFDEIVAFAEVERFLDTPVKHYSSGMYVRLAFSVAAHLEPEILVVDEVLAVGDAEFQKRCLGKMQSVSAQEGRTVLFVSHNMGAIQSLCASGILLKQGRLFFAGSAREAVERYGSDRLEKSEVYDHSGWSRTGTGEARIVSVRLEDAEGRAQHEFCIGEALVIRVRAMFFKEVENPSFGVSIETDGGVRVTDLRSFHSGVKVEKVNGTVEFVIRINPIHLYPRRYWIQPWVASKGCDYDWVMNAAEFEVTSGPSFLDGARVTANHGIAFIPVDWTVNAISIAEAESTA